MSENLPPYSRKPITLPDGTAVIGWSGPTTPTRPQRCGCGRPVPASSSCGCCCAECDDCTEDGPDPNVCAGCDHQRAFHRPEHDGICLGHCDCTEFEVPTRPIPARLDERYDPSPEPIDRSIQ